MNSMIFHFSACRLPRELWLSKGMPNELKRSPKALQNDVRIEVRNQVKIKPSLGATFRDLRRPLGE